MATGFTKSDPILGTIDLDDEYIQDQELIAKSTTGNLYAWGTNYYGGPLGVGDEIDRSSPTLVSGGNTWAKIAGADVVTCAIKSDGTLWSWGRNIFGELGLGDTTSRSTPVQVGTDTNWKDVSCGYYGVTAIRTDGTLWSWGLNNSGQLGLGDTSNRSSPTQVGTLTNWMKVHTSANTNYMAFYMLKTDGTLWGMGANGNYALMTGDNVDRSSPVQMGTDTNWKMISSQGGVGWHGIKTDGTLWFTGSAGNGSSGLPFSYTFTTPVQVATANDWRSVSSRTYLKKDGSAYYSDYLAVPSGTNGMNLIDNSNSWKKISGSYYNGYRGLKTDGTLWAWGVNTYNGSSTPVQVGTSTNWIDIIGTANRFFALSST